MALSFVPRPLAVLLLLMSVAIQLAQAAPKFTNSQYNVVEGKPFTLIWVSAAGPVSITLMDATSTSNMKAVETIDGKTLLSPVE
jgi:hypothetical protein